jgi:integrase
MGRVARDVLTRRLATSKGSKLVFPNPMGDGGVIGYDTARAAIARAIARAKVRPGTAHDLRHSYGRALALAGVPITVIQSQMGHTNLKMTQRYTATGAVDAAKFLEDFGVGDQQEGAIKPR